MQPDPTQGSPAGMRLRPLWKRVLVAVGFVSVALGVIGIVVPLLPTTPFLLLAAACFIRSSDRAYRWLMTHRLLGPYIRNYREHRAATRRAKVVAVLLLWAAIGYSVLVVVQSLAARIALLVIAVAVTAHVLTLRTLAADEVSVGEARRAPRDAPTRGD